MIMINIKAYPLAVAVYALLIKEGELFLLKRQNTGFMDGYWSLPAGRHDGQETVREACLRELKEEAGVFSGVGDLRLVHLVHRRKNNIYCFNKDTKSREVLDLFFTVENWQGEAFNAEPEKASEGAWFSLDRLPEKTIPFIRQAVLDFKDGNYSEYGWPGTGNN